MSLRLSKLLSLLAAVGLIAAMLMTLRGPAARSFFEAGLKAKSEWHLDQAIENFQRALRLRSSFVEARFEKALCHQLRGEFLASREEIASLRDEAMSPSLRARLLNAAGVNHFNSNEADAAIRLHTESLSLARELEDRRLEAEALIDLSRVLYHLNGQPDRALDHLNEALLIGRETGDEIIEAHALRNIGVIRWWFKGDLDRPLPDYYLPALEIYRRHGELRCAAIMLSNISLIYSARGDLFQSLKYQSESIELKRRVGDMAGLCDSYYFLGLLYDGIGNYRKARDLYLSSVELSRRTGYRLTLNEEYYLTSVYMRMGEYDKAIESLNPLLERERGNLFQTKRYLGDLAHCHLLKGDAETARLQFERVLEIERLIGEPDVRSTIVITMFLGEAWMRKGDFEKASELFASVEEMSLRHDEKTRSLGASLVMAEFMDTQGRRAEALRYLTEAAEMQSQRFRSSGTILVAGQSRQLYDRIFSLLLDTPRNGQSKDGSGTEDELAFRFLEQWRYSSFRSLILQLSEKKARPLTSGPEEKEALRRIEKASDRFKRKGDAETWAQLRRAYSDYEDLTLKSELAYPRYRLVREASPATLEVAQRGLDSQTALVEYLLAGEKVYALVVTRTGLKSIALPVTKTSLAAKVKLFRSLVFGGTGKESSDWQPVSEDLRRLLIAPLEESNALAGVRRLGLVPFSFLHDLPFAALARVEGEKVRFLIEDYSLFHSPSASWLARSSKLRARDSTGLGMLSFGRNESEEPELMPLEFAVEEARQVASIFGGEARAESEASETALKQLAPHFRYIHLATHAVTEPDMPLLSRLKLQSSGEDDGDLTVREILDLGIEADLVTLGACRSGLSHPSHGDESSEIDRIGLIEAFLHAGAESVMASLLPISDRPTTEFMKVFYSNLRTKEKADALTETQRAMIRGEIFILEDGLLRQLSHPRYWATFILVGDHR